MNNYFYATLSFATAGLISGLCGLTDSLLPIIFVPGFAFGLALQVLKINAPAKDKKKISMAPLVCAVIYWIALLLPLTTAHFFIKDKSDSAGLELTGWAALTSSILGSCLLAYYLKFFNAKGTHIRLLLLVGSGSAVFFWPLWKGHHLDLMISSFIEWQLAVGLAFVYGYNNRD